VDVFDGGSRRCLPSVTSSGLSSTARRALGVSPKAGKYSVGNINHSVWDR
jgi:hypothetical protein